MEMNEWELPFIDISLLKEDDIIRADLYYNNNNSRHYLDFKSCHPPHTKRNIPFKMATRIYTIYSEKIKEKGVVQTLTCSLKIKTNLTVQKNRLSNN